MENAHPSRSNSQTCDRETRKVERCQEHVRGVVSSVVCERETYVREEGLLVSWGCWCLAGLSTLVHVKAVV